MPHYVRNSLIILCLVMSIVWLLHPIRGGCDWVDATVSETPLYPPGLFTNARYLVIYKRDDGTTQAVDNFNFWSSSQKGEDCKLGYVQWKFRFQNEWNWSLDSLMVNKGDTERIDGTTKYITAHILKVSR